MYPIPGHLAFSVLGNRYLKAEWIPVIVGAFLPDLIDKPLNDVFHITPYGRYAMHSLFGLGIATLVAFLICNRKIAYSYCIGHASHLIADADFNPWFWPFIRYEWPSGIDVMDMFRAPSTIFFPSWIFVEALILGLAAFLYTPYSKKKSVQIGVIVGIVLLSLYRITRERPL
jgi:hypothetical protein